MMQVLDDPVYRRRRRLALLVVVAVLALVAGLAVGAGGGDDGERAALADAGAAAQAADARRGARRAGVSGVPLRRLVGRLIILRFIGPAVPAYVREALRAGRATGAILFRDNLTSPAQLRELTGALHSAAGRSRSLVAVDQEGGDVRVIPWIGPERSARAQAAAGTVRSDTRAAGAALRAAGIDLALAPVADVPTVQGAALSGRSYADDPEAVSRAVADAVRGFRDGGVLTSVKHFPGLGGALVNTDDGPSTIARPPAKLETDLAPFRAAIGAGAPLVMLGHARYPALDPERIASQSRAIATRLLRDELGFRGAVITDSMEAAAVTATGSLEQAAERSVEAGADLLLCTGQGSSLRIYRALLARARRDPAFASRLQESAARVAALPRRGAP